MTVRKRQPLKRDDAPGATLAYVEDSLPGASPAGRLALARRRRLALEVACRGGRVSDETVASALPIVSVQAWDLHDDHPLHPDPARRAAAACHMRAAMEWAARLGKDGAARVVAICAYGREVADRPQPRCIDFFSGLAPRARELGVRILIEPLSPLRAGAMTEPGAVEELLAALAAPDLFGGLLDTGHLLDGGHDPAVVIAGWRASLDEIQLRGADSAPPGPEDPLEAWLEAASRAGAPPPVVAIEHRRPITQAAFETLVFRLRRTPHMQ